MGFHGLSSDEMPCHLCHISQSEMEEGNFETDFADRTKEEHVEGGRFWLGADTATTRKITLRQSGYRHNPFNEIDVFDSVRFSVIDLMHCLLLGLLKHLFVCLTEVHVFTASVFGRMQEKMNRLYVPDEIGRTGFKFDSNMAKMKADEVNTDEFPM
jgi:hypothetical protein